MEFLKMPYRRINFFAGPCSGKSVLAAYTFSKMKMAGLSVEYTPEYIKSWTYIPIGPKSLDAVYIQAKQIHAEDIILRGETDYIVSDSPVFGQVFYAWHYSKGKYSAGNCWNAMLEMAKITEDLYPSLNIFLERVDSDYNQTGRYENLEQAKDVDRSMRESLDNIAKIPYITFSCRDVDKIVEYILDAIKAKSAYERI